MRQGEARIARMHGRASGIPGWRAVSCRMILLIHQWLS